jgi:hypothetical protein
MTNGQRRDRTADTRIFRHTRVTVRKPHKILSPKAILASQTPFAKPLKRLREIAEKCGRDNRQYGSNPVVKTAVNTSRRLCHHSGVGVPHWRPLPAP